MQICIVLRNGTMAHSTIHHTGNTAILLAFSSNAANVRVRRYTGVYDLAWNVLGMSCICRNYVALGVTSGSPWL